jgi:hypothetical protein
LVLQALGQLSRVVALGAEQPVGLWVSLTASAFSLG